MLNNLNEKSKNFRDGQNYWILRSIETSSVRNLEGSYVCDYPQYLLYENEVVYVVCHLNTDQEVIDYISSYKATNNVE